MKYYLVNYSVSVSGGSMVFPHKCRMFAISEEVTPIKSYEYIKGEIDREYNKPFEEESRSNYFVVITDMRLVV